MEQTTLSTKKQFKVGLFGFGCIGQGIFELLQETTALRAEVKKIVVKNRDKIRPIPSEHFFYEADAILNDPEIEVVIELIDDAEAAYEIVTAAMRAGKAVISANKKMIATHLEALLQLQREADVPFLYEASACGSIPIIRNLEEYYNTDFLSRLETICNGTTNYILTKTANEGLTYNQALKQAQDLGFAESDPTLDVQGFDAKFKLVILALHAFGITLPPETVLNYGIQHLNLADTIFAKQRHFKIKLLAKAYRQNGGLIAYVAPHFIPSDHEFYNVENEFNAVQLSAQFSEKQTFIGKGAGSHPTASAVLSDLAALRYDYRYEYKNGGQALYFETESLHKVYVRYAHPSDLIGLDFECVLEQHTGIELNYIIGEIRLKTLIAAELNDRTNLFVCFF